VLRAARQVSQASAGAFDVTVQPLWALYDRAQRAGRLPTALEIATARAQVGWQKLSIEPHRVRLTQPDMAVTLNGIAQGYAADAARQALMDHSIAHALLDTGEFSALGRNEHSRPWTLGVEDPRDATRLLAALQLDGRCLATSADNRSAFTPDHRHHHIFDPSTGDSPAALSSVTVAAPTAMLADALTKVMFVGGPKRIPALARQWRVGVLWVDKQGRWAATPDLQPAG
jgi:thiamine biosynthesis lipoprotein